MVARGLLRRGAFSHFGRVAVLPSLGGKPIAVSGLRCDGHEADLRALLPSKGRVSRDGEGRGEDRRVEVTVTHKPGRLPR